LSFSADRRASNEGTAAAELPFVENEAFRMLRASLRYFNVDSDVRTVLVASYMAGVGKSTVTWNLARVAATSSKVVIVETDMRNASLAAQHGLAPGPGLAELLTHQVGLEEAIQAKPIAAGANGAGGGERSLDVIVAGASPPNPAELIESAAMDEVLAKLAERYELVVLDTAPMGVVSDAFPLLGKVDGAIAVTRIGLCTRDSAAHLREQLTRLEAPVLGIVANAIKLRRGGRYGYYGGHYGPAAEQRGEAPGAAGALRCFRAALPRRAAFRPRAVRSWLHANRCSRSGGSGRGVAKGSVGILLVKFFCRKT
jgi:capsular exopolysaccharide synthesis family protein